MLSISHVNKCFIEQLGISEIALQLLCGDSKPDDINRELELIRNMRLDMPVEAKKLGKCFQTKLWTMLGELSVSNNLGEIIHTKWPVLIFPYAIEEENIIKEYIVENGFKVAERESIVFNEELHASLYGGQPWFESLRYALSHCVDAWGKKAVLLWIEKGERSQCSIAAFVRKMQLQLRPTLKSYEIKPEELMYPGILKAFHTPHLGNVEIHTLILSGRNQ
jgi:hypothetical protein